MYTRLKWTDQKYPTSKYYILSTVLIGDYLVARETMEPYDFTI